MRQVPAAPGVRPAEEPPWWRRPTPAEEPHPGGALPAQAGLRGDRKPSLPEAGLPACGPRGLAPGGRPGRGGPAYVTSLRTQTTHLSSPEGEASGSTSPAPNTHGHGRTHTRGRAHTRTHAHTRGDAQIHTDAHSTAAPGQSPPIPEPARPVARQAGTCCARRAGAAPPALTGPGLSSAWPVRFRARPRGPLLGLSAWNQDSSEALGPRPRDSTSFLSFATGGEQRGGTVRKSQRPLL